MQAFALSPGSESKASNVGHGRQRLSSHGQTGQGANLLSSTVKEYFKIQSLACDNCIFCLYCLSHIYLPLQLFDSKTILNMCLKVSSLKIDRVKMLTKWFSLFSESIYLLFIFNT